MGGTFTNFNALKAAMLKEVVDGVTEATEKSFDKLQENVDRFYDSPESPNYHRTGQLKSSPMLDGVTTTRNGAVGQVSINTGTQYVPAGRDTNWIYHAAESDDLWGNGGFWADTESEIRNILNEEMAKRFG